MHLPSSTPLISIIPPLFPYLFLFFFLCNSKDYSRWIKIKRVSPFLHSRHPSFLNLKDFLRGKLNLHTRVFRSSFFPFFDIRRFASSSFKNKTLSPRCFLDMKFGYMEGRVNPETIRDSPVWLVVWSRGAAKLSSFILSEWPTNSFETWPLWIVFPSCFFFPILSFFFSYRSASLVPSLVNQRN